MAVDKLVEVASSPEGLAQVLNLLQHETANVATEVMSVNSSYDASKNEALLPIINNYNALLRSITSILDRLQPKISQALTSAAVQRAESGIKRSLATLDREVKDLANKVASTTIKRT